MQLVMLAGELGEKYGKEHEYYNLRTPADAIKLLCVNYPAFRDELITAHQNGIGYKVIQGNAAMGYDELRLPFGSKPLLVVPVITGSGGSSTTQILLGVGLVAASFLLPGAGLFGVQGLLTGSITGTFSGLAATSGLAGTLTTVGTALSAVGAGLILGGTAQLLSPQPEIPKANRLSGGTRERGTGPQGVTRGASGEQSYAFTGPANTIGTGATVPVIYGRVITGSHLIATDLDVTDETDPALASIGPFSRRKVTVNGDKLLGRLASRGGLKSIRLGSDYNFGDTDTDNQVKIDHTFGPLIDFQVGEGSSALELDISDDDGPLKFKKDKVEKTDFIFALKKSLFDYVGEENETTIIDGFIQYEIECRLSGAPRGAVVASASATIQGKFKSSHGNPFIFAHRLKLPKKVDDADRVKLRIRILDSGVRAATTFTFVGYGYNLIS